MAPGLLCPDCGSEMQLRTARRGRNAGGQFYGCSRFPHCRGTLSLNEANEEASRSFNETYNENIAQSKLPHDVTARSKFNSYQTCFIESVATSYNALENFRFSNITEKELMAFSQFRIDFLKKESSTQHSERARQIVSVCEKLLSRGRVTLCSPYVEKEIEKLFGNIELNENAITLKSLIREQLMPEEIWLDSDAEESFYYGVLPEVFNKEIIQWVTPQVEITSLLPKIEQDNIHGRVDFLIHMPGLEEPLIVEIDGEQHLGSSEQDEERDELLNRHGYIVKRFSAEEVIYDKETIIEKLRNYLGVGEDAYEISNTSRMLHAIKIIHQIQITVIQAIKYQFLSFNEESDWKINIRLEPDSLFNEKQVSKICKIAIKDLMQLINNLCELYSYPLKMALPNLKVNSKHISDVKDTLLIAFDTDLTDSQNVFLIQNICLPFHIANNVTPTNAAIIDNLSEKTLLYFLNYLFRKSGFWEGQLDAINRAFGCKDAILLLPTGGGKSIAFQMASLLLPGRTIVIEPIISLIEDQLDNLASYGIDRCSSITSLISGPSERKQVLNFFSQGEYLLLYVAPERFQTIDFRDALRGLTVHSPINIVVIDEAHCVSEWGHDFRTAYLNIGRISREYCESQGIVPPLIALTGTASRSVLKDVQRELQINDFDAIITPNSFDRPELKFNIITCKSSEKFPRLKGYLGRSLPDLFNTTRASLTQVNGKNTYSGLVFCPWVNGEYGVVQVSKQINEDLSIPNDYYSGKVPKYHKAGSDWASRKQIVAKSFKYNEKPLLTCTKAFGMGIDKSNIRYTIHYGLPFSLEAFYQEAGRAGRDRRIAHCCILASIDDHIRAKELLVPDTEVERIAEIVKVKDRQNDDDITRALFFHIQAFRGVEIEVREIEEMLKTSFSDYADKGQKIISYESQQRNITEKCLHRLLILGIIDDYTIDYSSNTFTVNRTGATKEIIIDAYGKYIEGYLGGRSHRAVEEAKENLSLKHREFVLAMLRLLLGFIYSVIEKGRRRALWEMFIVASERANNDIKIRNRILTYLEETEHTKIINEMLDDPGLGLNMLIDFLEKIRSPNEAAEIRGQAARYLESYPDHPSLLMLRALTELFARDKDFEVVKINYFASIKSILANYELEETELHDFVAKSLKVINKKSSHLALEITNKLTEEFNSVNFSRTMVRTLPEEIVAYPALHVLALLHKQCLKLIKR